MTDTLSIRDNRTGREYEVAITDGTIRAADLNQIAVEGEPGLATYDPGFVNTSSCRSSITYIDGDVGILEYRGYPIEQLAEHSTFLEVSYLLLNGELPTQAQLDEWVHSITYHTFIHENLKQFIQGFRYDAHPMGMLMASVSALSTFYPTASKIGDPANRQLQITRLIAKMPTLGAFAYRHQQGKPYVYPDNARSYTANFLAMLFKMSEPVYAADERLVKALEVLFILHADHEQNCSTNAVRSVGSSQVDPYSAVAAGIGALYGPLHGGARDAQADQDHRQHSRLHRRREGGQGKVDGLRPPGLQELRPSGQDHQEGGRRRVRGDRHEPAAGHRARAREDRARGRVLHQAQALPQRRLLLRADL